MEPHQLELLKISLSQRHAKQKLLDGVAEQLQLESRRLTLLPVRTLLAFAEPGALLTVLSGVVLLACSATGCDPMQSAQSAALGCGLLLLAMLNAWVTAREEHREATELISRARGWLNQVSQHQTFQSRSTAAKASPHAVGVLRDGVWVRLHPNLLVEGDVLWLRPGDTAPGRCRELLPSSAPAGVRVHVTLEAEEAFVPLEGQHTHDASAFLLAEDVASRRMTTALRRPPRPLPPMAREVMMVRAQLPWLWLLVTILGLCAATWRHFFLPWQRQGAASLASLASLASPLTPSSEHSPKPNANWLAEELLPHLVSLGLPLLPMAFPVFYAAARALGGAYLLAVLHGMPARRPPPPPRRPPPSPHARAHSLPGLGLLPLVSDGSGRGLGRGGRRRGPSLVERAWERAGLGRACSWMAARVGWLRSSLPQLFAGVFREASEGRRWWHTFEPLEEEDATLEKIGRRGPETLLSDTDPNVVSGSRFVRYHEAVLEREQWSFIMETFWRVLRGGAASADLGLLRASRLVESLGAVTVLACHDKPGILSDGAPSVKQARFVKAAT